MSCPLGVPSYTHGEEPLYLTEGKDWDFPIQCVAALAVVGIPAAAPLNYTAREARKKSCGVVILLFVGFLFSLRNFFESRKKS